eukprot:3371120-Prymnesium_polylepis.1
MKIDPSMTVQAVVDHVETTLLAPLGLEPTFTAAARKDNNLTSHWSWIVKSGDGYTNLSTNVSSSARRGVKGSLKIW